MASEEEIIAIDTKEDIEESTEDGTEDIIEIPIDRSPDRPEEPQSIKLEFQCDICLKVLSSKNNLKEIDQLGPGLDRLHSRFSILRLDSSI